MFTPLEKIVYHESSLWNSQGTPILRSLEVIGSLRSSCSGEGRVFRLTGHKPQSESVLIDQYRFSDIDIVWNRITHLMMSRRPVHECLAVLSLVSELETYRIVGAEIRRDQHQLDNICHTALRSLQLVHTSDKHASSSLLEALVLPHLTDLSRRPWRWCHWLPRRSSCLLKSLSLHIVRPNDLRVIKLLRTPSLKFCLGHPRSKIFVQLSRRLFRSHKWRQSVKAIPSKPPKPHIRSP